MSDDGNGVVVDATIVEEQPGGQLVHVASAPPPTLFRTDDPAEVIVRASKVAEALKDVLKQQGLTQNIQGKDYVKVEGWQTVGAMLGVTAVCTETHKLENGWEARVEARTLAGQVIGAAEAECLRDERRWKTADDYAVRSMAQTRATSKALRSVLAFVVTLAGYEPTPAEEMDGVATSAPTPAAPSAPAPKATAAKATAEAKPSERKASAKQKGFLNGIAERNGWSALDYYNILVLAAGGTPAHFEDPNGEDARASLRKALGRLPAAVASAVIEQHKGA